MRDTLHCVHIRWLIEPDESSIDGLLWNMSLQKSIFYFLSCMFCPLFTVSPPSLFSLAPRIHPVPWTEFSKWFPPFFWLVISDYWFCSYSRAFPHFTLLRFLNSAIRPEPYRLLLFSSVSVHLSSTQLEQSQGIFLYEWFMILSFCRNTAVYLLT